MQCLWGYIRRADFLFAIRSRIGRPHGEICYTFYSVRGMRMQNPKLLDEINEKVRTVLAQSPAADIEKNMRAMLTALFSRLDLVTREEFDVQSQVLARTREKLAQLEAKLAELEKKREE